MEQRKPHLLEDAVRIEKKAKKLLDEALRLLGQAEVMRYRAGQERKRQKERERRGR